MIPSRRLGCALLALGCFGLTPGRLLAPCARARACACVEASLETPPSVTPPSVEAFNDELRSCARRADAVALAETWRELRGSETAADARSYGIVMNAAARKGDADAVLGLLGELRGLGLENVVHWTLAIGAVSNSGQHARAAQLHDELLDSSTQPSRRSFHAFFTALSRLAQSEGDVATQRCEAGLDVMAERVRDGPDARAFQTVVAACRRAGDWQRLLRVFERHERAAARACAIPKKAKRGVDAPDALARTAALQACRVVQHGAKSAEAILLRWLRDAADRNVLAPDAFAFSAYAAAHVKRGDLSLEDALALCGVMETVGALQPAQATTAQQATTTTKPPAVSRSREGEGKFFASLIMCTTVRGRCADALRLLAESEVRGAASPEGYDAALATCGVAGDAATASAILSRTQRRRISPTRRGWDAALRACAAASPPAAELADVLVQRMEQETSVSPKATSYSAAISACAKFGDFVRALSLYSRALERGQANAVVLGATVAACRAAAERAADPQTAAKAADAAVATLLRALPALSSSTTTANTTTHDLPLRGFVYRDAVLAVCAPQCPPSADRALAAERVRRKAAARGVDVGRRARNSLLLLLASSGQWRVGAMLLREASRDGGGANSAAEARLTRPSVAATTAVVRAAEREGKWREALALLDDMRKDKVTFYANPILDTLFRQGVMVWSTAAGGEQLLTPDDDDDDDDETPEQ